MLSCEGGQHSPNGQKGQQTHVLGSDGSQPSSGSHESQSNHHDPHHFGKKKRIVNINELYVHICVHVYLSCV